MNWSLESPRAPLVVRYGVALLAVALAIGLRFGLLSALPIKSPFLLLFPAVMLAAAYGGLGPGIAATVLAAAGSDYFLTTPPHRWTQIPPAERAQLGLFVIEGLFLSLLGAMLYRARRRATAADEAARRLEQKILEISESERHRIGHDLHDGLGQHLTGIALLAKALKQRLGPAHVESAQAARIADLVNESIGWTRILARGLSPVTLETDGLAPALEELAVNASSMLNIRCTCTCDTDEVALDGETSLHLYRIAQEAINNSVKHGRARTVKVGLSLLDGRLTMSVLDDGSGLSEKTRARPGIGLQIMHYRARMISAALSVERAAPEGGTLVRCTVPIPTKPGELSPRSKDEHVIA